MQKHFYKIDDDSKTITIYCTIHSYVVMYAVFGHYTLRGKPIDTGMFIYVSFYSIRFLGRSHV